MWLQTQSKRFALLFVRAYQIGISPLLHLIAGPGMGCRLEPHCSQYAQEAIEAHGPLRGGWLSMRRVLRCNPFTRAGSDPVPRAIAKRN